ncbi:hypothetical protein SAMN06297144_2376 [Sphingomonas guangdongensis]|uniref:Capsule biosynthesis protein n=1 Tax=Sphingomonas guangdongensis TaxID=1141890 RepID=A0A285R0M8_9SPHN|nr:hypothetical protein SAMN06297144_2376 [Sphingomonas guangdongensis]
MPGTLIDRWFRDHPRSVGESYAEHLGVATSFGARLIAGGVACMIHGLLPNLFTRTGSNTVKRLYSQMVARQPGSPPPAYQQPEWRPEYEI